MRVEERLCTWRLHAVPLSVVFVRTFGFKPKPNTKSRVSVKSVCSSSKKFFLLVRPSVALTTSVRFTADVYILNSFCCLSPPPVTVAACNDFITDVSFLWRHIGTSCDKKNTSFVVNHFLQLSRHKYRAQRTSRQYIILHRTQRGGLSIQCPTENTSFLLPHSDSFVVNVLFYAFRQVLFRLYNTV